VSFVKKMLLGDFDPGLCLSFKDGRLSLKQVISNLGWPLEREEKEEKSLLEMVSKLHLILV
jgi:hypothetical protein